MKKLLLTITITLLYTLGYSQNIGIGTNTPHQSAILDVSASNKGFLPPRLSTTQRNSINNPSPGLTIYNLTTNNLEWWNGSIWISPSNNTNNSNNNQGINASSNGTANIVSWGNFYGSAFLQTLNNNPYYYNADTLCCLLQGIDYPNYNNIFSLRLDGFASYPGTANLYAINNGISFYCSDTFNGIGPHYLNFKISGSPTSTGIFDYTFNTSPNAPILHVIVNSPTSNGTASVSSWSCNTGSTGQLYFCYNDTTATQIVTANVITPGTYTINANNSLNQQAKFYASGIFTRTGPQEVTLKYNGGYIDTYYDLFQLDVNNSCYFTMPISGENCISVTTAITETNETYTTLGGNVSNVGVDSIILARGIVWGLNTAPTIALYTKTFEGTGPGSFSSTIFGLNPATTYYFRAYATTAHGTTYGNEVSLECISGFSLSDFEGGYANTTENSPWLGAYTYTSPTTATITALTATTANLVVSNIYDYGWPDVTFIMDWTDLSNKTVRVVTQSGLTDLGGDVIDIRPFFGNDNCGTFSSCDGTITLKMQARVNGGTWYSTPYIVYMNR